MVLALLGSPVGMSTPADPVDQLRATVSSGDPLDALRRVARELREATAGLERARDAMPERLLVAEACEVKFREGRLLGYAQALIATRPQVALEARAIVEAALAELR